MPHDQQAVFLLSLPALRCRRPAEAALFCFPIASVLGRWVILSTMEMLPVWQPLWLPQNAASLPRIEIAEERRRSHDAGFRARVLAAASAPGARVEDVARRFEICTSLIYRWRRSMLSPPLSAPVVKLVPVRVAEARKTEPSVVAVRPKSDAKRPGPIEIELENGIRIRVDADVSQAALRRVVTALRG